MHARVVLLVLALGLPAVLAVGSPPAQRTTTTSVSMVLDGRLTETDLNRIFERTFQVPLGAKQLDIDVSYTGAEQKTVIDVGLRGPDGLRGWMGGRGDHIHIDRLSATYGYLPGALEPGTWAVILGVPNIRKNVESRYQIAIRISASEATTRPELRSGPGWYAGDLHIHSGHSDGYHADGNGRRLPVAVSEIIADARDAHLDFIALTDHNTASQWLEVERSQAVNPGLLLLHAREITTYRGHFNAIGERQFTDFRLTPERPMRELLPQVGAGGAFLSINHAWRPYGEVCMGCGWLDTDHETLSRAHGFEVVNGTQSADDIEFPGWRLWADLLNRGERLIAVSGSDTHDQRGSSNRIGQPATVVYAAALSEDSIVTGLKSGRVFVRVDGINGPSLDLSATAGAQQAFMGGTVPPGRIQLTARVDHAADQDWIWIRRGREAATRHLTSDAETISWTVDAVDDDWIAGIVRRNRRLTALSNPIYVNATSPNVP